MAERSIILIICLSLLLIAIFLSSLACEPFWEKYVVSTRDGESGDVLCHNWCSEEFGVMSSTFNFIGKDQYGFSTYECRCDLRDCGNPFRFFGKSSGN